MEYGPTHTAQYTRPDSARMDRMVPALSVFLLGNSRCKYSEDSCLCFLHDHRQIYQILVHVVVIEETYHVLYAAKHTAIAFVKKERIAATSPKMEFSNIWPRLPQTVCQSNSNPAL